MAETLLNNISLRCVFYWEFFYIPRHELSCKKEDGIRFHHGLISSISKYTALLLFFVTTPKHVLEFVISKPLNFHFGKKQFIYSCKYKIITCIDYKIDLHWTTNKLSYWQIFDNIDLELVAFKVKISSKLNNSWRV